jgi:hypothetical protein
VKGTMVVDIIIIISSSSSSSSSSSILSNLSFLGKGVEIFHQRIQYAQ